MPQDLAAGSYFGRRTAADGMIDWRRGALAAHNLIRAVAPPYPGAYSEAEGLSLRILRSLPAPNSYASDPPVLQWHSDDVYAHCHDGALKLLEFELGIDISNAAAFHKRFGGRPLKLKAKS